METINEVNVAAFDIERSEDPVHFIYLATVKASEQADAYTYQFTDTKISSAVKKYYYRIKQRDNDRRFTYSPTVSVDRTEASFFSVRVPPNSGRLSLKNLLLSSGVYVAMREQFIKR